MINKEISYIQDHLQEITSKDLQSALSTFSNPEALITSLLNAIGFDKVVEDRGADFIRYHSIVQATRIELIEFAKATRTISGNAVADIAKAFTIVMAIEGELSDLLSYPADSRMRAVNLFLTKTGISVEFYKKILSNWKKFG